MLIFFFAMLVLILLFPDAASEGSKHGLLLWSTVLLPSLLPFSILTSLVRRLMQGKPLHYLLLAIGALSGYPIGAKIAAELYADGVVTRKNALFLAGCANNPSAMFVLFFVAGTTLQLTNQRYLFYGLVLLSSLLGSLTYRLFSRQVTSPPPMHHCKPEATSPASTSPKHDSKNLSRIIDEEISSSCLLLIKIGGYIMLFSIVTALIQTCFVLPYALRLLLCGSLEVTTGTVMISATALPLTTKKILTLAATTFGGLSAAAQTNSVLQKTGLPISRYVIMKLLSSMYAVILGLLFL